MATGNAAANQVLKSSSKTVTDTLVGEHQHQIVGYSLIKGIGDGEPIASERFTVGGHEWVRRWGVELQLLDYEDPA